LFLFLVPRPTRGATSQPNSFGSHVPSSSTASTVVVTNHAIAARDRRSQRGHDRSDAVTRA
jgi:hypothetical protein